MRGRSRVALTFTALAGLVLLVAPSPVLAPDGAEALPTFSESQDGWNTLRPGGETGCAHGDGYMSCASCARPGERDLLLVHFYGGGACWDAEGSEKGSEIYARVATRSPETMSGILVDRRYPAALGAENLRLYQVDHGFDLAQRLYVERAGTPDPGGECPQSSSRYTFRCALILATTEFREQTHQEVTALLEGVRARVEAGFGRDHAANETTDTIHVAPPTGDPETDQASIRAALEAVAPGGTVLFSPGRYLVGPIVRLDTPGVTLLGHPEGTVLRGCELDEYEAAELEFLSAFERDGMDVDHGILRRCGTFHLTGGEVTIRGFTFEQSRMGVVLGCCESDQVLRSLAGGYRIEGNTFRNTGNSVRAWLQSEEPTVIRDNVFTNTFHALSAFASRIHFLDNRVSVPEPARVPFETHPGFAVTIGAFPVGPPEVGSPPVDPCTGNVIAGNHVEGHPDAVVLFASPGTACRDNVIQDNALVATRVPRPEVWRFDEIWPINDHDDPTFVGLPLRLWGDAGGALPPELVEKGLEPGRIEGTRVEGNRILGADGLGIQLLNASASEVVGNAISNIRVRDPWPGNNSGAPGGWEAANGSGIWLSPGSDQNEIRGNTFEDVDGWAVFVQGQENRIETVRSVDRVRDEGRGNQVLALTNRGVDPSEGPADGAVAPETMARDASALLDAPGLERAAAGVTEQDAASPADPCGHLPTPVAPRIAPNDNRTPAGELRDGVLTVSLVMTEGAWYPDGPDGCAIQVRAFAEEGALEEGAPPQIPGPLLRTPTGTELRVTVRNALPDTQWVRGLEARPVERLELVPVAPGESREFHFTPTAPGTHYYASYPFPRGPPWQPSTDDGSLVGALVIDPPGEVPDDRIFVLNRWTRGLERMPEAADELFELNTMNGLSWPHTERLVVTQGEPVRWRVVNPTNDAHLMHLHGFYFRVLSRGIETMDVILPPGEQPLAVTEIAPLGGSIVLEWVPEEPGNWIFHCHLVRHMTVNQRLDRMPIGSGREDPPHAHAAEHAMAGLVMGVTVEPAPNRVAAAPESPARTLRLFVNERPGVFGDLPGFGFVLQEGDAEPAPDSIRIPGSPLVLTRDEPTEIVVLNQSSRPVGVHWHGLELESFFDGVPGWSGVPDRVAPAVAPGDSFAVRITPPRAGTFFYHTHNEHAHELVSGLYGPFLVLEPGETWDQERDRVFVVSEPGPGNVIGGERPAWVNGTDTPPPVELEAGVTYRFRFIGITADDLQIVRLEESPELVADRGGPTGEPARAAALGGPGAAPGTGGPGAGPGPPGIPAPGGPEGALGPFPPLCLLVEEGAELATWSPVARDGASLSRERVTPGPACIRLGPGTAQDVEFTPDRPGRWTLNVQVIDGTSGAPGAVRSVPVMVKDPSR